MQKSMVLGWMLAAALTSSAAWEKIGTVEIAGTDGLAQAIAKAGKMTGNEMLGTMASGALMNSEPVKFFGPTRAGASVVLPLYLDSAKCAKDSDDWNEAVEYAILYPVAATKAKFLKHHKRAVETNGYIRAEWDGEDWILKFSEDGKWLAASDKREQVDLALAEAKAAPAPLGDELARFSIGAKGMDFIRQAVETAAKAPSNEISRATLDIVKGLKSISLSLSVTDAGLDLAGAFGLVPGSEFAKVGRRPLAKDALAFAGKDALYASASAADTASENPFEQYEKIRKLLAKQKLDISVFLACTRLGEASAFTLDVSALVKYCEEHAEDFTNIDADALAKEYEGLALVEKDKPFVATGPAVQASFAVKGFTTGYTPTERFAATFPELKGKPLCGAGTIGVMPALRAILTEASKAAKEEEKSMLAVVMAMLPPETPAAIAGASWRQGDELRFKLRVATDEIKGLAMLGAAVTGMFGGKDAADDEDEDDE